MINRLHRGGHAAPRGGRQHLRVISAQPPRWTPLKPAFPGYQAIVDARASHQLSDAQWDVYLADDDFAAWYLAELLQH